MTPPTTTLPSGDELPLVGIGTWNIDGDTVRESVRAGLDAGYGHIDTAEGYRNEREIGDVLSEYDRKDVFLTSKVLPKNLDYESVIASCEASLERLGTEYLDLYLVHWPNPAISLRETLDAMATLHEDGKVRNIGVSNFDAYQLSCAHHISDVPIAVNQVEYHPWNTQETLLEYCRGTETVIEAAAPFGRTEVFADETVQDIAEAYDRSPAQIVLKWAVENEIVVLPKSTSPEHVRSNLDLFDWTLDEDDRDRLDAIDHHQPVYDLPTRDWTDDTYGIAE
ncbi:aldo/keto reductase [Natrialba asiatica]|uniref:Aldo/keto reductase family oxidoreductase n=1 Tax=Natrialba asiatica (strain ATCC 700177 / DSM 12278 / JCM 9576 / FERM P-10747 / NBRC 102637 / 172P1) TaxID=29540 RepID=M0AP81_NATA1|nr:aldo/keto reductase [Natrialba asiatica]ELZ00132.1 aldo/keto reductase family oxidoreductase [Natrialba asiatica DSM 12278]